MLVSYYRSLSKDRDFLFEPDFPIDLNFNRGLFIYIVNSSIAFIQVRNTTATPIKLPRNTRLRTIIEWDVDRYYQVSYKSVNLVLYRWRTPRPPKVLAQIVITLKTSEAIRNNAPTNSTTIDSKLEYLLPNSIIIYGYNNTVRAIRSIVSEYKDIFIDPRSTIDILED